jgi:EmrB/QacA subfamily drug resistance transporter
MKEFAVMETEKDAPVEEQQQALARRLNGMALVSVLIALLFTMLLEALDQTIVGTAMPKIIADLQGFDRYTWVVNAYLLAATMMIPIVGKLSDLFGRKWFLVVGVALFLVGSVLSGMARTIDQLIAYRALQGLGSGIGITLAITVVGDIFPPAERAKWQSILSSVYGLANLVGPTLGGWLSDHGPLLGTAVTEATRWRWVFYINLPMGGLALVALLIFLPVDISERSQSTISWAVVRRIDFIGAVLVATATTCLLLGFTWGSNGGNGWGAPLVIGMLAGAGVLYALFVLTESRVVDPILPLGLFRNQVFTVASLLSLLHGMILLGLTIYLPFFLQGVLGVSATNSGAVLTPMMVSATAIALLAGFAAGMLKRYQFIAILGALVMGVGILLLTQMTPATSLWLALIFMVITGIGLGVFFSVVPMAAQNALPRAQLGVGTAAVKYLAQLGPTLGVALVGTVVNSSLSSELARRLSASTIKQLTPAEVKVAIDTQSLLNPAYRTTVVKTIQGRAVERATAHLPTGPQHDIMAQQVALQVQHLLNQVFETLRLSLAVAIQRGFWSVLVLGVVMLLLTFFLKDLPIEGSTLSDGEHNAVIQKLETPAI